MIRGSLKPTLKLRRRELASPSARSLTSALRLSPAVVSRVKRHSTRVTTRVSAVAADSQASPRSPGPGTVVGCLKEIIEELRTL